MGEIRIKNLAIISTHPIQYNAPFFKLLQERGHINIKVFYTWGKKVLEEKFDPGFGREIQWDVPLLEGYEYEFVDNVSGNPGSHHFKGIDNPILITLIQEWKADALLIYGWSFKSHLKLMRYFKGKIPVLFRGDSTIIDKISPLKKIIRTVFLKWVYKHVDQVLYVGTNNKKYYQTLGFNDNQMIFMPHAIDNSRFYPNQAKRDAAKKLRVKHGIGSNSLVFLFAGKLEAKKNCSLLIRSFKRILNEDIHLVIVGSGDLKSKLELMADNQSNIHFIGFQNQQTMPELYQLADIYVLPSKGPGETWGLSINEAMASGKVILVSDACGAAVDLAKDGINGFIFKSDNLDNLKEKMILLIKDRADLAKMGIESQKIIGDWSYEKNCQAIESILV